MADATVTREGNFFDAATGSSYGVLRVGDRVFGSVQGASFFFSLLRRVNGNEVQGNFRCALSILQVSATPPPEPEPEPTGAVIVLTEADGRVRYFDERLSQN